MKPVQQAQDTAKLLTDHWEREQVTKPKGWRTWLLGK